MPTIAPGAQILVRDAVWRVLKTEITSNRRKAIHCVGLSEIVRDQPAIFVDEYEPSIEVLRPEDTTLVEDTSERHRGALTWMESLLRDVPPQGEGVVLGDHAALDPLDFQLEPALLGLGQPRARILIADAVGLGKTLEAGILLSELIRRGKARRILVVGLKSMLAQLQRELWTRFTIPLTRLDSLGLQRIRRRIPSNHNPFHVFDRAIISIDTLKQHNAFRAHLEASHWDVVVIDEAHNVARRGSGSQRRRLAEMLADRCDHMILLSATPHDGRAESFASLMNLLDPTAIANPKDYTAEDIQGLYTRRMKGDVAAELGKAFPEREVHALHATASATEEAAFDALTGLTFSRIDQRAHGGLLFRTTLEKALFSSPSACLQTLRERIRRLERRDDAEAFDDDITQLRALETRVEAIEPADFSRYQTLLATLRGDGPLGWRARAPDDRLVIFTERIATMSWLAEQLPKDLGLKESQVATLCGDDPDIKMQQIVDDFGQRSAKLRLLIASDVAAEGLNLHYQCHRLVHFDVPWSLMTFQQRNGRVDRYGQTRTPQIVYLLTNTDNDRIRGDQRILEVLIDKDRQAQKNLGDQPAFMGLYDPEAEEQATGRAMERGQSAEDFETEQSQRDETLLDMLLAQGAVTPPPPPPERPLSLFPSTRDYLLTALDLLRQDEPFEVATRDDEGIVDLAMPDDLVRRMRQELPDEAFPADHRLVLTPDAEAMMRLIDAARGEADAWPKVHYLWPLHPLLDWVDDRVRHRFGRMQAPVLRVPGLAAGEQVLVVSALLPNERGQPLVHRWYAVRYAPGGGAEVLDFAELASELKLGRAPLPNRGLPDGALAALQRRVGNAVTLARAEVDHARDALRHELSARLAEERARLSALKARHNTALQLRFEGVAGTRAEQKREAEVRRIDELFHRFDAWVKASMTMERTPFLQIVAGLVGGEA